MAFPRVKIEYIGVLCQYWKIKLVEGAETKPEQYACTAPNMLPDYKTPPTLCSCSMNSPKMQMEYMGIFREYWEIESMMLEVEEVL